MNRGLCLLAPVVCACALLVPGTAAAAEPKPLHGPAGTSHNKVLVIGTDGTRWDLLQRQVAAGKAPIIAALARGGLGAPTLLQYQLPEAATLSEVGWCSIASGVWPAKHGVSGYLLNNDPGQATKRGFADFLTRIERTRPALSTFLVSDWPNIGLHEHGGPIFSDAIDARHSIAAADTIPAYQAGDDEVTDVAARYLRDASPDAGFVYFGLVDETAHAVGSATPAYLDAIAATDRRIGRLVSAIRGREDYGRERWTIILTTDHGERNFSFGSYFSHGFNTALERTSFVVADGPGVPSGATPRIVDIAPTVLHQLGVPVNAGWNLDGRSFVSAAPPPPPPDATAAISGSGRRARLSVRLSSSGATGALTAAGISLPPGVRLAGSRPVVARADGRAVPRRRLSVGKRRGIVVRLGARGARRVTVSTRAGELRISRAGLRRLRAGTRLRLRLSAGSRFVFPASISYRRR